MRRETFFFASIFFLIIGFLTLLLPIELYDGYVLMENGELAFEKLSLSYFLEKESFLYEYRDAGVVDFGLNTVGWVLLIIVNFGLPMLLGYRVAIARHKKRAFS